MHEEPLEEWARRREERRDASKGKLRAVLLASGPNRGSHVEPDAPRVMQRWSGTEWETVGVVEDLAAAKALLHPPQLVEVKPAQRDRPSCGRGPGRHRRSTPAKEQDG
ncbi:DUF6087 family protein [Streptomyces sp. H39-S7]|uniref:DUF6087 family protein n=1 Tax=Streptomyces sp. H39-S7 TaxID=3004357 RepID=UPI0022AFDBE9|nr:DUF6087 family protein [Streptomyces sp. H39-S7]MCZ4124198.1 DUF6087 family protein [Streptomyces sp. H39-S7]